jgi:hypothetical protein
MSSVRSGDARSAHKGNGSSLSPHDDEPMSASAGAGKYAPVDHEKRVRPGLAASDVDNPNEWETRQRTTRLMATAAECPDEKLYLFKTDANRRGAVLARTVLIGYYNYFRGAGSRKTSKDDEHKARLFREVIKAINCVQQFHAGAHLFMQQPTLMALRHHHDGEDEDGDAGQDGYAGREQDDDGDETISDSWKTALISHKALKPAVDGGDLIDATYVSGLIARLKVFMWKAACVVRRGPVLDAAGKVVYNEARTPKLTTGKTLRDVMAAIRFRVLEALQTQSNPPKKLNTTWEWSFYQDGYGAHVLRNCAEGSNNYDECKCRSMYV